MKRILLLFISVNFIFNLLYGQRIVSEYTTNDERCSFRTMCTDTYSNIDYEDEKKIQKGLWLMSAFNQSGEKEDNFLRTLILKLDNLSASMQYNLLATIADRTNIDKECILRKVLQEGNAKQRTLAYSILLAERNQPVTPHVNDADWRNIVEQIHDNVFNTELTIAQVTECLSFILKQYSNQSHIVVLLRADRNIPAKVYVVNSTGIGERLSFLGRSAYNILPYFTNGNTPCGIFKIKDKVFSDNKFIGPVRAVQTTLPFEVSPEEWGMKESDWDTSVYEALLPKGLKKEQLLWQAYWAGKVGRGDIIVHGSTIDPLFFKDERFFPLTPSLGCLSALELWNVNDGSLLESHQQRLVESLPSDRDKLGFMYVFQVDEATYNAGLINK